MVAKKTITISVPSDAYSHIEKAFSSFYPDSKKPKDAITTGLLRHIQQLTNRYLEQEAKNNIEKIDL